MLSRGDESFHSIRPRRLSAVPSGRPMPYWCTDCRRNFSVRIGSAMERSKIGYQKWAVAIYMWATSLKGVSRY